jgi:hypothetical protein
MSPKEIKEIAEELNAGMQAFVHKKTKALIFIPNQDQFDEDDMEPWEEALRELKTNRKAYFEVEKWTSSEAYKMMVEFSEQFNENPRLQQQLLEALNKRKPFREFNFVIDHNDEYRQEWFAFKDNWQQEHVRKTLLSLKES